MFTLLLCIALFAACWLANALFLKIGAKLARTPRVSWGRACGTMLVLNVLATGFLSVSPTADEQKALDPVVLLVVFAAVPLVVICLVLRTMFRTSFWRAVICCLALSAGSFVTVPLVKMVVHGYIVVSMSMAPTLLPPHQKTRCEHCEREMRVTHFPDERRGVQVIAACQSCGQLQEIKRLSSEVTAPDRFLVNKLIVPRRWDMIAYRVPGTAEDKVIKRVVGLPGEEVVIRDGAVWINGAKADAPPDVAEFHYNTIPVDEKPVLGSPERPARLGPDEYFVLGDAVFQSLDSRHQGPVPAADVEGVVGLIYWPKDRWRLFR